nr:MAG TPA: hypothetical protein [Caudoviricetes sp.]
MTAYFRIRDLYLNWGYGKILSLDMAVSILQYKRKVYELWRSLILNTL